MFNENQTIQQITFMYKNEKVFSIDIVLCDFNISFMSELNIHNKDLLPLYMQPEPFLYEWYKFRCFYNSMCRYNDIIYCLCGMPKKTSTRLYNAQMALSLFSYGANLTDKYWVNPSEPFEFIGDFDEDSFADKQIILPSTYEQTNFFQNPHTSENFGLAMMQFKDVGIEIKDFRTPEICTNGDKHKRWVYENGMYHLEKIIMVDNLEEWISPFIKLDQSIRPQCTFSKYTPIESNRTFDVLKTPCLTDLNTELISAYDIICSNPKNSKGIFETFERNFLTMGKKEDYQKLIDSLKEYSNNDLSKIQCFDNFGFIRDCNTKEIVKPIIWSLP